MHKRNRVFLFLLALALAALSSACHKTPLLKKTRSPEGVVRSSFSVPFYVYEASGVVKESPPALIEYVTSNLSRLSEGSPIELAELNSPGPITQVGNKINFEGRLGPLRLPSQVVTLKSEADREIWLMFLIQGNWVLWKIQFSPIPEGSLVHMNLLFKPDQVLKSAAVALPGVDIPRVLSERVDLYLALVQAKFDPSLSVEELTARGPRGELFQAYLQGEEFSLKVSASPSEVVDWIFASPERMEELLPLVRLQGECFDHPEVMFQGREEMVYCPSRFGVGPVDLEANVVASGGWKEPGRVYLQELWITVMGALARYQFRVEKAGRGSEIKMTVITELPSLESGGAADLMIAIAGIPDRAEKALLRIKEGVEQGY